jgi:hypothetical protein
MPETMLVKHHYILLVEQAKYVVCLFIVKRKKKHARFVVFLIDACLDQVDVVQLLLEYGAMASADTGKSILAISQCYDEYFLKNQRKF